MLLIDFLGFKQKEGQEVKIKTAALWSIAWVSVASLFGAGLWLYLQQTAGVTVANTKVMEYFAGYLLEKSLAVDNVFVWLMLLPSHLHYNANYCFMVSWARLFYVPSLFLLARGSCKSSHGFCISSVRSWCIRASNSSKGKTKKKPISKIWRS